MDLAEKRKQLQALRAARQAKQQVVDQYISDRLSNPLGSSFASTPLGGDVYASVPPTGPGAGASASAGVTAVGDTAPVSTSVLPQPRSRSNIRRLSSSSIRLTASSPAASSSLTPTTPAEKKASTSTTSNPSAFLLAQPVTSEGYISSDLSQVCSAEKEKISTPARHVNVGGAGASADFPTAHSAVWSPHGSVLPPLASSTAATPSTRVGLAGEGWDFLRDCIRNVLRDSAGAVATQPVCIFNPSVLLGDTTRAVERSRRRVVLASTSSLVPYEGAVTSHQRGDAAKMVPATTVCVAAAYGACDSPAAMSGGYGSELSMKPPRRDSVDSAGTDNLRTCTTGGPGLAHYTAGSFSGAYPQRPGAAAAAMRVRACMDYAYPWGFASSAPSTVAGTTMESVLKVAQESPGLVLVWFLVPLHSSMSLSKGNAFARATPASGGAGVRTAGEETTTAPECIVVVLPLVCDSEVTTLLTHPLHSSILLGGTRCGRIVQWSMCQAWAHVEPRRLLERALATTGTTSTLLLPPQRPTHSTFPSPQAHQAPVLRMAIHGDASCHHLYSISQEGKVCTWSAWQPLHPTASRLSYLGIRPMGNSGVAAQFVERAGTDAMTKVFIGTTSGALLVGTNRDAKSIELQYCGPSRALPTSSTVIKTLDITAVSACQSATVPASTSLLDHVASSEGASSPVHHSYHTTRSSSPAPMVVSRRAPPLASQPHQGRIVSMCLQTITSGVRGRDCVVSAAADGSCVAWFDRSVVPLEGFSSAVTSVCWSPTRSGVLAAGDATGLVTLWSVDTSIITPAATISLRDAGRRARGNPSSDGVLWVVTGASDAAAVSTARNHVLVGDEDGAEHFGGEETDASLGQSDVVGAAVSSLFFSSDGQWLFASTASGYVHTLHLSASMA